MTMKKLLPIWISIHAPTRGATGSRCSRVICVYFNPRSHEGSDSNGCLYLLGCELFQSTLPRGERRHKACRQHQPHRFQSTLPRGERPPTPTLDPKVYTFQSTLPRGERRCRGYSTPSIRLISIHAPTRGATIERRHCWYRSINFNPRSHEGSDPVYVTEFNAALDFNPRSHEGSDVPHHKIKRYHIISIHAPTRGATAGF